MRLRNYFLFLTLVLLCEAGFSKPVSEQEALRIAEDFFHKETFARTRNAATNIVPRFTVAYTCYNENKRTVRSSRSEGVCYYVIHVNGHEGYVIVSGDDRARQILAYSNENGFDPENLPANCIGWLRGYQEEISALMEEPEENAATIFRAIDYPTVTVAPLIKTQWAQGDPYNLQCPIDKKGGENKHSAVGCTATATAQIMYYHQWPEKPKGQIKYYDSVQGETREMNFDERPAFDWQNMLPKYTYGTSTEVEQNAVANLMACVGHAAQMTYSAGDSRSYIKNAAIGLKEYFNYDENIHRYEKKYLSSEQWNDILIAELVAGRPVLYDGYNQRAGHAFVCDGYDGKGLFHFNWGWNGASDGYYALTSLIPGEQGLGGATGTSYTFLQSIVCHIQPPTENSVPQEMQLVTVSLSMYDKSWTHHEDLMEVDKTEKFGIQMYYDCLGVAQFKGEVCFGTWVDGQVKTLTTPASVTLPPSAYDYRFYTNWADVTDLSEGTYEVHAFYKEEGVADWVAMKGDQALSSSYLMTIGERTVRLEQVVPDFKLTLNGDFIPGNLYNSGIKTWTLDLLNNGTVRLEGKVGVRLQKVGEEGAVTTERLFSTLAYCDPGESVRTQFFADMSGSETGEYIVTPFYCRENSIYAEVTSANIVALGEGIPLTVTRRPSISIIPSSQGYYVLDKQYNTVEVTVSQPSSKLPWEGRIYGKIFEKDGNTDTGVILSSELLVMNKPSLLNTLLKADQVELPEGDNYTIVFYMDDVNDLALSSSDLSIVQTGASVSQKEMDALQVKVNKEQTMLYLKAGMPMDKVTLTALSGCVVRNKVLGGTSHAEVSLQGLSAGVYLLQMETEGRQVIRKIMIP